MRCIVCAFASNSMANCPVAMVNAPDEFAKKLAVQKLGKFLICDESDPVNDQSPCNTFASKGLEAIYGVKDFRLSEDEHMSANAIFKKVTTDSKWRKIGKLLDNENALCAQSLSNSSLPVVAVLSGVKHGHVALILPGEPTHAPSWKNILAPNSASFFYGHPIKAYINGPLNKAFGIKNAEDAIYYYRQPD